MRKPQLHTVKGGETLRGVGRPSAALPAELGEPAGSEPGQVRRRGKRHQCLVRADVRGRLLAADVLLSGLEGEHVSGPPVDVDGLSHDATGEASHVVHAGGDDSEVRSPEVQVIAEHLSLADRDVGAQFARRREYPQ